MIGGIARGREGFIYEIRVILGGSVVGDFGVLLWGDFVVCVEMR